MDLINREMVEMEIKRVLPDVKPHVMESLTTDDLMEWINKSVGDYMELGHSLESALIDTIFALLYAFGYMHNTSSICG